MFDVKAIRDDPVAFDRALARRGAPRVANEVLEADTALREAKMMFQAAQAERNEKSKLIGAAKAKKDEERAAEVMAEVEALKADLPSLIEAEKTAADKLRETLAAVPNIPADDVPDGVDEHGNIEVRRWREPRAILDPKDHVALGEALGMMDFEAAARMSGARFVVLRKDLARLERALGQFMLDLQTREHGYEEVSPPLFVRQEAMFGTGQLPKFYDDAFLVMDPETRGSILTEALGERALGEPGGALANAVLDALDHAPVREQYFAIPTAEVSLTNLVREQITPEEALPIRLTALTPCFRAEAGSHGRDTRGMIRQHQFWKCELVSITTPEQSATEHDRMTQCAEAVLKRLELPFRTMLLCAGDMGFSAIKTYDLEVWLPSQGTYREISSCSNCGDFQARRMEARIKKAGEKGTRFPHTLNGSGLAVGRTLVAVMETYQDEGGRIAIPEALQPYMGGQTDIGGEA